MSVKNFCWMVFLFSITNVFGQGKINENNRKYQILKRGDESISIPFKMKNNKPVFDLMVNNRRATLMIDNGILWDPVWLFGTSLVNELQLTSVQADSTINLSENDPTFSEATTNLTVQFEDIVFFEQPVIISPPEAGFVRMFPGVDGQLSNTLFKHFIVEFDFINQEVILHNSKDFKYKGIGSVLDMTITETGTYAVPFSLVMPDGKVYNDKVDIDFGGIHQLKIALNETNQIELPDNVEEAIGIRFKGVSPEYKGKITSMTIGKYTFNNPTVYYGDKTTSRVHPLNLGRIGLPMFLKFNIIFDYFNNKIYLEPNENFDGAIDGSN